MKDLLEAFTIFAKYIPDVKYPTWCDHDVLAVICDPDIVSEKDKVRLDELGFRPYEDGNCFRSYRFGSA